MDVRLRKKEYDPTIDDEYIKEKLGRITSLLLESINNWYGDSIVHVLNEIYEDGFKDGYNEAEEDAKKETN